MFINTCIYLYLSIDTEMNAYEFVISVCDVLLLDLQFLKDFIYSFIYFLIFFVIFFFPVHKFQNIDFNV